MNKLIKIIKDTPFHKAGIELSIIDFRAAYGWICTPTTTNEELIKYIETGHKNVWSTSKPPANREYQLYIGDWFKVIELEDLEPLRFIYEGAYYTKGFDGMYHCWRSPEHFSLSFCGNEQPIAKITISEVRKMIEQARFKQHILYCTNNVNKKL